MTPMEPVWAQPVTADMEGRHCHRCRSREVRSLGLAGSTLLWIVCRACGHVWAEDPEPHVEHTEAPHE
jgi:hypothetical protein